MNRFYVKALGTICYDATGLTYPEELRIDLVKLAKLSDASEIHWENQFGWADQPQVLCMGFFTAYDAEFYNNFVKPLGLMLKEHWDWEDRNQPW
jgi:hypothetical protein